MLSIRLMSVASQEHELNLEELLAFLSNLQSCVSILVPATNESFTAFTRP
jgi:hypothetical protein